MHRIFDTYPFLIGLISFLVGLVCMPAVLRIAKEKHFVVKPNKRMSHTGEIPNVGGIDICVSFLLTYLIFEFDQLKESQFLLVGLLVILVVGFADDLLDLSPLAKIIGEMVAGVALIVIASVRITHLHGFCGICELPDWASYLLSFFLLIVITNALNLIDGIDGLASGLGILYCLFFGIWFQLAGEQSWAVLSYSMTGALAVFFLYNVFGGTRRKIFMGDSGSLLLGYMLTAFVFHFCELNAYRSIDDRWLCTAAPAVAVCAVCAYIRHYASDAHSYKKTKIAISGRQKSCASPASEFGLEPSADYGHIACRILVLHYARCSGQKLEYMAVGRCVVRAMLCAYLCALENSGQKTQ